MTEEGISATIENGKISGGLVYKDGRGVTMSFTIILGLLGGLALFLHGMQMMSSGLEAAAGNQMKSVL